ANDFGDRQKLQEATSTTRRTRNGRCVFCSCVTWCSALPVCDSRLHGPASPSRMERCRSLRPMERDQLMRRMFAGLWLLLMLLPARAANPGESPRSSPQLHAQAVTFASQILAFAEHVAVYYFPRKVREADLLEAALSGLYEAMREPLPPGLHHD